MPLKQTVTDAFATLGLTADVEYSEASRAYKKLALQHHPDKNQGDPDATKRFQKISIAWDVCSKHYENPSSSEVPQPGSRYFSDEDDDNDYYDDDDDAEFFQYMFQRMFMGGFRHSDRRDWRKGYRPQRSGSGGGFYFIPTGFRPAPHYHPQNYSTRGSSSNSVSSEGYASRPQASQKKEYEEYLKRVQEFEEEVKQEKRQQAEQAKEEAKARNRILQARVSAFKAGHEGQGDTIRRLVEEFDLEISGPEKIKSKGATSSSSSSKKGYETMLHAAARACDGETLAFLVSRGADVSTLNDSNLYPFHVSILNSNVSGIRYFQSLKPVPEGCHPSKAALDGRTPLQLALAAKDINKQVISMVLKDATVHDVEKCFLETKSDDIKAILATKKGFRDPTIGESTGLSKKAKKKQEEERAKEEKARKIAEERARAEEKRKIKEKNAKIREDKRLKEEQEARETAEREEAIRMVDEAISKEKEAERRAEEEKRRLEEERRQQEAADRLRQEEEERRRLEAEQRRLEEQPLAEEAERQQRFRKQQAEVERQRKQEEKIRQQQQEEFRLARELEKERKNREKREEVKMKQREAASLKKVQQEADQAVAAAAAAAAQKAEAEALLRDQAKKEAAKARAAPTTSTANAKPRQVCRHFQKGNCRFENNCRHLHEPQSLSALPPVATQEQERTSPVPTLLPSPAPSVKDVPALMSVNASASVPRYAPAPSQTSGSASTAKSCKFFAKGHCTFGNKCKNAHIAPDSSSIAISTPMPPFTIAPAVASTPASTTSRSSKRDENPPLDEATIKRRAEQSARDRARSELLRGKRQKEKQQQVVVNASATASMPTPSPSPPRSPTPKPQFSAQFFAVLEDFQTREIADDYLFPRQVPDEVLGVRDVYGGVPSYSQDPSLLSSAQVAVGPPAAPQIEQQGSSHASSKEGQGANGRGHWHFRGKGRGRGRGANTSAASTAHTGA